MLKKWHYVSLTLVLVILCLCLRNLWYLTQLKRPQSSPLEDKVYGHSQTNNVSENTASYIASVKIIGSDYEPEETMEMSLTNDVVKYVLIVPHKLDLRLSREAVGGLSLPSDENVVRQLSDFLDKHLDYDGATGVTAGNRTRERTLSEAQDLLKQNSCRFKHMVNNWTVVIRNSGSIHKLQSDGTPYVTQGVLYQECNISESAFLIRKKHFLKLRWRFDYGCLSHLDFFLRSKGSLKIAKLSNVYFSQSLSYIDGGNLEGSKEFMDYSRLGKFHSILRIVRPHKIEWMKCSDDARLCQESSYEIRAAQDNPGVGSPICCDDVMDDLLVATVKAMNEIGMDYRITYGTLLGAERSGAIIPHSDDIDLAIHKRDNDNFSKFLELQKQIGSKYRVAWKTKPPMSRIYPNFPPSVEVDTEKLFIGNGFESEVLFNPQILLHMKRLFPIQNNPAERRFVDMYPSPEKWFKGFSNCYINGRLYRAIPGDTRKILIEWYGEDYKETRPEKSSKTTLA